MAKTKITDVTMSPSENGFIISYCERSPAKGSSYDGMSSSYKKKTYSLSQADEAMEDFMEMSGLQDDKNDDVEGTAGSSY